MVRRRRSRRNRPRSPVVTSITADNYFWSYNFPPRTEFQTTGEVVRKVIISDDDPRLRGPKNCSHYTMQDYGSHVSGKYKTIYTEGEFKYRLFHDPKPQLEIAVGEVLSDFVPDWDRAVQRAIPSMRNEFNLINFALEWGDIRDLPRDLHENLTGLLQNRRVTGGGRVRRALPSIRTLAESNLISQLGILPAVSDGQAILDVLNSWSDRLATARTRLARGNGFRAKTQVKHVFRQFPIVGPHFTNIRSVVTIKGIVEINFGGYVFGDLPWDPMSGYFDYIGFYPDLSTLWNALPFTFIIDYFIPIGDALAGDAWLTPNVQTKNCWFSYKFTGSYDVTCTEVLNPGLIHDDLIGKVLSYGPLRLYHRFPAVAELDGIDVGQIQFPNFRQMGVIASLGTALGSRR